MFAIISLSVVVAYSQPAPTPSPEKSATPSSTTAKPKGGNPGKPSVDLPPEKAAPIKLAHFDKPPVIDGKLDEDVWKHAVVLKDFYQIQPGDNIAPQHRSVKTHRSNARLRFEISLHRISLL